MRGMEILYSEKCSQQEIIGFQAIRVDTRNKEAKELWLKQGFVLFKKTKRSLFLPVKTILRQLEFPK